MSKSCPKLSKSCPSGPEKIQKNPKKSEKIQFFHFFSYGLGSLFIKSRCTIYHIKLWKKCWKKKSKKKWFSFLQTFFLKSILDIFLCPISKLKKKFWKLQVFPFLDLVNITIHPSEIDFSCFFCGIRIFRGTFGNSSFFRPWKYCHSSPEKRYFMFFLWNSHFQRNFQ